MLSKKAATLTLVPLAAGACLAALAMSGGASATTSPVTAHAGAVHASALPPGYQLVVLPNENVSNFQRRTVYCPGAKKVLGGGAEARGADATLVGSFPTADGRGWIGLGRQGNASTVGISVFAICAD
jgi:hypothetical protein